MSHPLLNRHLQQGRLKPLYLFFGAEEYLMERALQRLEQGLADQAGEPPHRVVAAAAEVDLADFLAEARHAPLFGTGQLLILRRVETYPAESLAAVPEYLRHASPRSLVVLTAPSLKAKDVEKHAVWSRLLKEEAALGFFKLREVDLHQWLVQEARGLGKELTPAAAQHLVEVVGDNLAELTQELGKLALFAGEERTLTPALVAQLATHSRTYTIFTLVEALGEKSGRRRLEALAQLLDLGEPPIRILAMLARQVRLLLRVKEAPAGMAPADLSKSLNLAPGLVRKLERQAGHFTLKALVSHLERLHRADLALKTSAGNPRLWLEHLVMEMGPG